MQPAKDEYTEYTLDVHDTEIGPFEVHELATRVAYQYVPDRDEWVVEEKTWGQWHEIYTQPDPDLPERKTPRYDTKVSVLEDLCS